MNKNRAALLALSISLPTIMYSMTLHEQLIEAEAARSGNIKQAQEALAASNTKYHDLAPLDYAVACRNVAMVELLLNSGADVNVQDRDGATVLHHVVTVNNSIAEEII